MKALSRRSLIAGSAAVVTAIPALGLAKAAGVDPMERIRRATEELEDALRAAYGIEVTTLSFGPHTTSRDRRDVEGSMRSVFVAGHIDSE
jgi:hypothetical protein